MSTKGQSKRAFILEQAEALFIQKGYAGTSMEDLVKFSGVSKGSIYYHFDSKEQLFVELIEKSSSDWLEMWRQKETSGLGFTEKLYAVTDHYMSDFKNPLTKVVDEFFMSHSDQEAMIERALKINQAPQAVYTDIFAEGIEQGSVRDTSAEELAFIFSGLLNGLGIHYFTLEEEKLYKLYQSAVEHFLHGVLKT
ncbi:TetR/AcrR family transcriptional regulator [Aureibacillus halotolerans]|uniref:TetR family transcriptional regulator n=1 Tax=Aureibacillus halotolerans TaxID=1508390 RepID=A0A4R6U4Z2_9BACI|nr:TetR/AcrR family transcriptional regulator [Aureibacillus halotolerans]TDQ40796.1 TetR family transcriptional regulator [Aureibacillus halotolerans]